MQVGYFCVKEPPTVPLTRISCSTVFAKSKNARKAGTLCIGRNFNTVQMARQKSMKAMSLKITYFEKFGFTGIKCTLHCNKPIIKKKKNLYFTLCKFAPLRKKILAIISLHFPNDSTTHSMFSKKKFQNKQAVRSLDHI